MVRCCLLIPIAEYNHNEEHDATCCNGRLYRAQVQVSRDMSMDKRRWRTKVRLSDSHGIGGVDEDKTDDELDAKHLSCTPLPT